MVVFFNFKFFFLSFFLTELGLLYFAWAFSSCGEQGQLFLVVHGLLIAVVVFKMNLRGVCFLVINIFALKGRIAPSNVLA